MTLSNKTVLVTGSGGPGCGRAIALRFAREGACVVVSDIDALRGLETLSQIQAAGGRAAFFRADISDESGVLQLLRFAGTTYGSLDVIVNNASAPYRPDTPFDNWQETINLDLTGPMNLIRHGIAAMKKDGGAVVNMASVSALGHGAKHGKVPAYDVAKAGLIRLTTTLGPLGSEGIRINCLAPGWIATPEVQAYVDSLDAAQREERGVPHTLLTTAQIAAAVVKLATDESLAGRVMVWWNDENPGLIPEGSQGYERLDETLL